MPGTLSAANYSITYSNGTLQVTPAALTITASNRSKAYGQTFAFAGTEFSSVGLLNGDSVASVSLSSAGSAAGAVVGGSPYSIVATNAVGSGLGNYTINYVNGQMTVTAAPLGVTANNTNRVYGATNPVFTVSYSGFVNSETPSVLSGAPGLTTSATAGSPVGPYTITNTVGTLVSTNYSFNLTNGTLQVTPAALVVAANNTNRNYGATNPVFTVSYVGLTNGDNSGVVSGTPLLTSGAKTNSPAGNYVITNTPGTLSAANYTSIIYSNGTLQVAQVLLTVTGEQHEPELWRDQSGVHVRYNGFVNGETNNVLAGAPTVTHKRHNQQSGGRLFHRAGTSAI